MPKANTATLYLDNAIAEVVANKKLYVNNPDKDFTRDRKLPMEALIYSIIEMKGNSLTGEMIKICEKLNTPLTKSAFVQQRDKLKSDAFLSIFRFFNKRCNYRNRYWGYRLLAVDGSDVNIWFNEGNTCINNGSNRYISQIHLNALYDLINHTYVDIVSQGRAVADERAALIEMYQRSNIDEKAIIIADRGYESLNLIAHFVESKNCDLLLRVKSGKSAIKEIANLPAEELDVDISIPITTRQRKEDKLAGRHLFQVYKAKFNKKGKYIPERRWDFDPIYDLKFRVVRFQLPTGEYETLVTTLPRNKFSLYALRDIYHMRWGIETSFRHLKYAIGLSHIHGKSVESALQEIYAAIIKYNYCEGIIGSIVIEQCIKNKHIYVVNHTAAILLCLNFFRRRDSKISELETRIKQYTEPLRPGRKDKRKGISPKGFVSFAYRVAA